MTSGSAGPAWSVTGPPNPDVCVTWREPGQMVAVPVGWMGKPGLECRLRERRLCPSPGLGRLGAAVPLPAPAAGLLRVRGHMPVLVVNRQILVR